MKKYRYIGIYRNFDCKFHVANFRKAIFKNTFSRTPAVAFSKMINLTREVFISFFIHFSSELDMQKILEIDLTFKLQFGLKITKDKTVMYTTAFLGSQL